MDTKIKSLVITPLMEWQMEGTCGRAQKMQMDFIIFGTANYSENGQLEVNMKRMLITTKVFLLLKIKYWLEL